MAEEIRVRLKSIGAADRFHLIRALDEDGEPGGIWLACGFDETAATFSPHDPDVAAVCVADGPHAITEIEALIEGAYDLLAQLRAETEAAS